MAERILTLRQAEDIFLEVTREILGISNDNSTRQTRIRSRLNDRKCTHARHEKQCVLCYRKSD